eukprot:5243134-Pyramimonas_sp.AAC.2
MLLHAATCVAPLPLPLGRLLGVRVDLACYLLPRPVHLPRAEDDVAWEAAVPDRLQFDLAARLEDLLPLPPRPVRLVLGPTDTDPALELSAPSVTTAFHIFLRLLLGRQCRLHGPFRSL